jgi:hypothetical protein
MSRGGILTIMDRGGGNEVIVPHANARVSWVLSGAGAFSAVIPGDFARWFGFQGANSAGAYWLRYEHQCLPDWGGVVTVPQWSENDLELGSESFHALMRKRRVPRVYGQQSSTPGALAQRAFHDVQADDYMFIRQFEADEYGDPVEWQWRGGDLHDDILRNLASSTGQEWTVDADRNAEWRVRLGTDKTASVMLYAPHEIVGWRYSADLWTVTNDLEGVASDARFERSVNVIREKTTSVKTIGRYQESRRYERVVQGGTLVRKVWADLHREAWPAETMDLTTINVGKSWERYHVGDSVGVTLPAANVVKRCRVLARSIDVDTQTESLGLDVEFEEYDD